MAECLSPEQITDFASRDTNRIQGKVGYALAVRVPYLNLLQGGTLESGISRTVRSVVQAPIAPAGSMVRPEFISDYAACQTQGDKEETGTYEYSYELQTRRGFGPAVCVKQAYSAFKTSYAAAEDSLKKLVREYIGADVRALLLDESGMKAVVQAGVDIDTTLAGNEGVLATPFPAILPDGRLTFTWLHQLATKLVNDFQWEPIEGVSLSDKSGEITAEAQAVFIGSPEQVQAFLDELDVRADVRAFTTGSYQFGEKTLKAFAFEGPYRGIAFGRDQRPLRYNELDENGQPVFLEPYERVAVSNGFGRRLTAAYRTALYEVGFLMTSGSFTRLVPEKFTGEATFKFNPQYAMGELSWHYQIDNTCNIWGDVGFHKYQITRAYRPERPHFVCPIAYSRCAIPNGVLSCSGSNVL